MGSDEAVEGINEADTRLGTTGLRTPTKQYVGQEFAAEFENKTKR